MRALSTFRNLTGGRIPPLTRTALLCGLGLFLLTLLVFKPGAGGNAPANALTNGVRLVAPGDARTESVVLLDSSAVYFPARSALAGVGRTEVGQPEDAPFDKSTPVLQFDPTKPLGKASTLQVPRRDTPAPAKAVPLVEGAPFTTFGTKGYAGDGLSPRVAFFEIYQLSGGSKPVINGKIAHFNDFNGNKDASLTKFNPFSSNFEVILSVDSFGKAPLGSEVRHSGSKVLDQAIRRWAAGVDWSGRLTPGAYRLIVGP
jgi:hypothetical protein